MRNKPKGIENLGELAGNWQELMSRFSRVRYKEPVIEESAKQMDSNLEKTKNR